MLCALYSGVGNIATATVKKLKCYWIWKYVLDVRITTERGGKVISSWMSFCRIPLAREVPGNPLSSCVHPEIPDVTLWESRINAPRSHTDHSPFWGFWGRSYSGRSVEYLCMYIRRIKVNDGQDRATTGPERTLVEVARCPVLKVAGGGCPLSGPLKSARLRV